ncbi:hypothetical protein [Sorangium sp. So ce426]|uniref:hypothetical protein n=1 Tax=Sorangium sp. So ce426 TaxID=3133312 RepID=UPI003F5C0B2C
MPHAVITSPSAAARLDRAVGWLRRRRPAERVLLVGASVEAVSELARASIRGRRATFGWHRLTLGRLAAALAMPALAERGLVPASALAIEALCARTLDGLAQDGLLGRFARVADRPGLPRAVARTLERRPPSSQLNRPLKRRMSGRFTPTSSVPQARHREGQRRT